MTPDAFSFRDLIKPGEGSRMMLEKALAVQRQREQDQRRYLGHRYQGPADLILTHGTFFTGRELPDQYRDLRGEENLCHTNSMNVALEHPELRLFTGFYMVGSRFQTHSWLVAPDGGVVEVTLWDSRMIRENGGRILYFNAGDGVVPWTPPETWAYCGIEYDPQFVKRYADVRGLPIIDPHGDHEQSYDLVKGSHLPDESPEPFKSQYDPAGFDFTPLDQEAVAEYAARFKAKYDDWDEEDEDYNPEEPEFA